MPTVHREYHKWWSPHLDRDMELLVFGHAGTKVLVFPTRGGRFYEYENLRLIQRQRHRIEAGWLQFYCVDSIDSESLYCFWAHPSGRIQRHIAYQQYVIEEVLPLMQRKNPSPYTIAHGCSLGAYHAANVALRHPQHFRKVVAFSGRYDLTQPVEWFGDLFDGYYDENIYFNTPCHFLPNLDDPAFLQPLQQMEVVLVVGREDPFLANNHRLAQQLRDKGVRHAQVHEWEGRAHRGYYWRRMVEVFL